MKAVLDNDILLKGVCYGLLDQFVSAECEDGDVLGVLGAARFVVASKIRSRSDSTKVALALQILAGFLTQAEVLEPSQEEQSLAADLELAAQKAGLGLDSGESQLCAIVVSRRLSLLLTGDKRAIEAIEKLLEGNPQIDGIRGKIKCLEQLVVNVLLRADANYLRRAICEEPYVDKALTNCFSCYSPEASAASFIEGLNSYIEGLRAIAVNVLVP
jgi:hypothetical protein